MDMKFNRPDYGYSVFLRFITAWYTQLTWFFLMVMSYFYFDRTAALWAHHESSWINHLGQIIIHFGVGGYYIVLTLVLWFVFHFAIKKPSSAKKAAYLFWSVALSGVACDIFKMLMGRARPVAWFHQHIFGFQFLQFKYAFWSFPSGHSTTAAAFFVGLSMLYPRLWPLCWLLAIGVCVGRVIVGAHFPSDTMGGLYLGSFFSIWLKHYFCESSKLGVQHD